LSRRSTGLEIQHTLVNLARQLDVPIAEAGTQPMYVATSEAAVGVTRTSAVRSRGCSSQ
jgi:hypothetical protein